jgi:hypothetical protein
MNDLEEIKALLNLIHEDVLDIRTMLDIRPKKESAQCFGAGLVQPSGYVGIHIPRDTDGGVAEALANDNQRDAGFERGDDVGVAGVVWPYTRELGNGRSEANEPVVELVNGNGEDREWPLPVGWTSRLP